MLRAAVIGLGVGEQHAVAYAGHPDCELAALCDVDEQKLAEVAARFPGARATTVAENVLSDPGIDVVSIASYDGAHYEQVVLALEHGKHVFVEKPLCMRPEEADDIRDRLAARPDLVLSSNLLLRTSPRFVLLKELLAAGRFGDLFYVAADYDYGRLHKVTEGWRGDLPYYSVVLGGGVHVVDLLLWLTGKRVVEVTAYGNRIATAGSKFRFDDLVVALLKFEDGALGRVTVNFGSVMPHFHAVEVYGTEATFMNGLDAATLFTREGHEQIDAPYPGVTKGVLIAGFIDAVFGRGAPAVTAEDVFATMDVCFAIEQAAGTQGAVRVPVRR